MYSERFSSYQINSVYESVQNWYIYSGEMNTPVKFAEKFAHVRLREMDLVKKGATKTPDVLFTCSVITVFLELIQYMIHFMVMVRNSY